ncbi:MAG TPA: type II secretion system protein [Vicinamibacterales bacterium]|nr:type II secretion system protein [Vicinamibacterales bacterium]
MARVTPTGKGSAAARDDGFVMVALLVSIAVAAVWMGTLLPSWRQQAIREREAELAFRGESYARAIYLYRQKTGNLPPTIDILVEQHYLRKKYVDPITGKDFLVVGGVGLQSGASNPNQQGGYRPTGIIGVRSTSTDTSIRIYNNQQTYSQWPFDFTLEQIRAGGGLPAAGGPAGGGRQDGRSGRGDELNPITPGGRGATGPGGVGQGRSFGSGGPAAPPPPPTRGGFGR